MAALPRHGRNGVTDDSGRCEGREALKFKDGAGVPEPANSPAVEKAIQRFHKRLGELRTWHCGRGCPSGDVCEVVKVGKPGPCEGSYGVPSVVEAADEGERDAKA